MYTNNHPIARETGIPDAPIFAADFLFQKKVACCEQFRQHFQQALVDHGALWCCFESALPLGIIGEAI
jgi:hypothetical protein